MAPRPICSPRRRRRRSRPAGPNLDAKSGGGGGMPRAADRNPGGAASGGAASPPAAAAAPPPLAGGAAPKDQAWDVVPVFYGTDRAEEPNAKRVSFSSDRGRRLQLGQALVTVPKSHEVPQVERPWAIRIPYFDVTIYEQAEDPNKHFTMQEIKKLSKDDFLALVHAALGRLGALQGRGAGVRARLQHVVRQRRLSHRADRLRSRNSTARRSSIRGRRAEASRATPTIARARKPPRPTCASSSTWSSRRPAPSRSASSRTAWATSRCSMC